MRSKVLIFLFGAFVDSSFAWAACAPSRQFCEALPNRSNPNAVIFLGVVKEIVPAPPLMLPTLAPGNPSSGVAPQARRRAGDRVTEPPMRYPVVRLQVVEAFSGVELGDFAVRLTSDHFLNGEPMQVLDMHAGEKHRFARKSMKSASSPPSAWRPPPTQSSPPRPSLSRAFLSSN